MNLHFEKLKSIFSRKFLVQIYFILFILLNIADFLDMLSGDIDFFKKILSWILIGYIFYSVSLTKITIGKRIKKLDIFYILIFSIVAITKSITYYVYTSSNLDNFTFFKYFLELFLLTDRQLIDNYSSLIGIILIGITSVYMLNKYSYKKESFLGSINLNDYFKFIKFDYIILIYYMFFFGIVVFNFLMEWFALAVDSLILVIGLFYYLFIYLKNHTQIKHKQYLQDVSNSGNNFYKKLILNFSDKKTIFQGLTLILTIHLLVDLGVFLVPYILGFGSSIYNSAFSSQIIHHLPIFNLLDFQNSQFFQDMIFVTNLNTNSIFYFFFLILIFLTDIIIFLLFFLLLFSPFYLFYKHTTDSIVFYKKGIISFFIAALILFFSINFVFNNSSSNQNDLSPLGIKSIDSNNNNQNKIYGVDIYSSPITSKISFINLFISISFFFTIYFILYYSFEHFNIFLEKLSLIILLLFFVSYILLFFYSYNFFSFDRVNSEQDFGYIINNIYLNKNLYVGKTFSGTDENSKFSITPFSNLDIKRGSNLKNHNDYLLVQINNSKDKIFEFSNYDNVYFKHNSDYNFKSKSFNLKYVEFIYDIKSHFILKKVEGKGFEINENISSNFLNSKFKFHSENNFERFIKSFLDLVNFFTLIFLYIITLIFYSFYYIKNFVLKNKNN